MEFWLHIVLLLAASAVDVLGFSSGAPMGACETFTPGHMRPLNQATGEVPFNVNTSAIGDSYTPDYTYTIILSGTANNNDFQGFLIQARVVADDSPTGAFMVDGETDQQTQCAMNTGATHTNGNNKETVMLRWTSPSTGTGPIYFRYAFVDIYAPPTTNLFYANLATAMITEGEPIMPTQTSPTQAPTTPTPVTTPTTEEITTPPVVTATPPEEITTPTIVTATPPIVTVTPPEEITTPPVVTATPPIVTVTPPEEITTPPIVTATPPEEITTPPVVTATPSVMMPSATPDDEVTGGATGLTVGTFMISLAVTLTISLVANVIN